MKFKNFKLKRCCNCKWYKRTGDLHYCIESKEYRKYGLELVCPIPLICFKYRRKK